MPNVYVTYCDKNNYPAAVKVPAFIDDDGVIWIDAADCPPKISGVYLPAAVYDTTQGAYIIHLFGNKKVPDFCKNNGGYYVSSPLGDGYRIEEPDIYIDDDLSYFKGYYPGDWHTTV